MGGRWANCALRLKQSATFRQAGCKRHARLLYSTANKRGTLEPHASRSRPLTRRYSLLLPIFSALSFFRCFTSRDMPI